MKVTNKVVTNTVTQYEANDGTIFSNKTECMLHEWKKQATKLYAVTFRGNRTAVPELYFTKEDALAAVANSTSYYVVEVYVNDRQWIKDWEAMNV